MRDMRETAWIVAEVAHAGQTDKLGEEYMGHIRRVSQAAVNNEEAAKFGYERVGCVAFLHDVLEDSAVHPGLLRRFGFEWCVIEAVEALTHRKNERRIDYYYRVSLNPLARYVKRFDVDDNADPERLARIEDVEKRARLKAKYADARAYFGWTAPESEYLDRRVVEGWADQFSGLDTQ